MAKLVIYRSVDSESPFNNVSVSDDDFFSIPDQQNESKDRYTVEATPIAGLPKAQMLHVTDNEKSKIPFATVVSVKNPGQSVNTNNQKEDPIIKEYPEYREQLLQSNFKHFLRQVKGDWKNLRNVSGAYQIPPIVEAGVKLNWRALQYIDLDKQYQKLCDMAVDKSCQAIQFCCANCQTFELIAKCLQEDYSTLRLVAVQTQEICDLATNLDVAAIEHVNPKFQTEELILKCIRERSHLISKVHETKQNQYICNVAFEDNMYNLRHINPEFQTAEMVVQVLQINKTNGHLIHPDVKQNPEIIAAIYKNLDESNHPPWLNGVAV